MGTYDVMPYGLTLKAISFTLSYSSSGNTVWRGKARVEDASGQEWLVFGDGSTLAGANMAVESNMLDGLLRKPRAE